MTTTCDRCGKQIQRVYEVPVGNDDGTELGVVYVGIECMRLYKAEGWDCAQLMPVGFTR